MAIHKKTKINKNNKTSKQSGGAGFFRSRNTKTASSTSITTLDTLMTKLTEIYNKLDELHINVGILARKNVPRPPPPNNISPYETVSKESIYAGIDNQSNPNLTYSQPNPTSTYSQPNNTTGNTSFYTIPLN